MDPIAGRLDQLIEQWRAEFADETVFWRGVHPRYVLKKCADELADVRAALRAQPQPEHDQEVWVVEAYDEFRDEWRPTARLALNPESGQQLADTSRRDLKHRSTRYVPAALRAQHSSASSDSEVNRPSVPNGEDSGRLIATRHLAAFCRQVAADGILPSLAWFTETAEFLEAAALRAWGAPPTALENAEDSQTRVGPPVDCVAPAGSTAEPSPSAVIAAERPDVWSYEGERHGRHDVSICLGGMADAAFHECYATAHGKTEDIAHARAVRIVEALAALPGVAPTGAQAGNNEE